ncbi:hypothetical protein D3C87_2047890 [compost metagenome]
MMGCDRVERFQHRATIRKRLLADEIELRFPIVEDGDLITMGDDMAGLLPPDHRRDQFRFVDFDIAMLAMIRQRNSG